MADFLRIQQALYDKKLSCRELTALYLDAIKANNEHLRAFITVTEEDALLTADIVDKKIARGEKLLPLEGVPMSLKDNIATKGIPTTCASAMLADYTPVYDAFVTELLRKQNSPLLGKTNMDEFAMGSTCETSFIGGTKNPHDTNRVSGGSSGGSAGAVAANLSAYSIGSDTGGSIRQPASYCGLVGLKPSYGAVSRNGLLAFASSLDQIGTLCSNVRDTAVIYDNIALKDAADMTSIGAPHKTLPLLEQDIRGLKIGIAPEFFDGIRSDISSAVDSAATVFRSLGAEIVQVRFPLLKYVLPVYYILSGAEASSNLGRYDGIRYGPLAPSKFSDVDDMISRTRSKALGREVKRRILLGTYVLSSGYYDAYYQKAQSLRTAIIRQLRDMVFASCDILLTPTVPLTAPKSGENLPPVEVYLNDICTATFNIAGLPALSIPCGFDNAGLPIGLQLVGRAFSESTLLKAAYQFERDTNAAYIKETDMGVRI